MVPTNLKYTKDHEWISVEGETCTVGITDFAQQELGDIVYVELPEEGRQIGVGESLGTIESVKAVSEVYAPLAGTVVASNSALGESPEKINSDPYGEGWICRIRFDPATKNPGLMESADYEKLIG